MVSRGLRVLGFTKKKLCYINIRSDPAKREQWWKLPPPEGVPNVAEIYSLTLMRQASFSTRLKGALAMH
jgi:hypothetical protein